MKKIGQYGLGPETIHVYADPSSKGGSLHSLESGGVKVVVGTDQEWPNTIGVLVHELVELALSQLRCRWVPDIDLALASDGYLFTADHAEFSEACARVGKAMSYILPDLSREYKRKK